MHKNKMHKRSVFFAAVYLAALVFGIFGKFGYVAAEDSEYTGIRTWEEWSYYVVDNKAYVCGYGGTEEEITIPSEIKGFKVTAVSNRLDCDMYMRFFTANDPQTVSVIIPEGITELRRSCFILSSNLERVTLPSTVERIGDSAFYGCSLTDINIPKGVKWIGFEAFNCSGISSVRLPEGLEGIDARAFCGTFISEITIPDSVRYLGNSVFEGCEELISVKLPEGILTIEPTLFNGCTSLKTVVFPRGVRYIDYGVFNGCTELESIYLPDSLEVVSFFVLDSPPTKLRDIYFEGTESRLKEISDSLNSFETGNLQDISFHYNYPPETTKKDVLSPEPVTVVLMAVSCLLLCGFVTVLVIALRLKKLKTPPKYNNNFAPEVLGSWVCEKCGTVNGMLGEYCYKCGRRKGK